MLRRIVKAREVIERERHNTRKIAMDAKENEDPNKNEQPKRQKKMGLKLANSRTNEVTLASLCNNEARLDSKLEKNLIRENLNTLTSQAFWSSPTYSCKSRAKKKGCPEIAMKVLTDSAFEEEKFQQMKYSLKQYLPEELIKEIVVGKYDVHYQELTTIGEEKCPQLYIDDICVGGIDIVEELEADGLLEQILTSSSFARGFLLGAPCSPEDASLHLASNAANSAVRQLRYSLDEVERKILRQSMLSGHVHSSGNGLSYKQPQEGESNDFQPIRLHHSWDVDAMRKSSSNKKKFSIFDKSRPWGAWELRPSTQAFVAQINHDSGPSSKADTKPLIDAPDVDKDQVTNSNTVSKCEQSAGGELERMCSPQYHINSRRVPLTEHQEVSFSAEGKRFHWKAFVKGLLVGATCLLLTQHLSGRIQRRSHRKKEFSANHRLGIMKEDQSRVHSPPYQQFLSGFAKNFMDWGQNLFSFAQQYITESSAYTNRAFWRLQCHMPIERKVRGSTAFLSVEPGDTLWSISEEVLGGGLRWKALAIHNRIHDPYNIYPGDFLELPLDWCTHE